MTAPLIVICQNDEGEQPAAFGAGREVQLSWDPRHTFVVAAENGVA